MSITFDESAKYCIGRSQESMVKVKVEAAWAQLGDVAHPDSRHVHSVRTLFTATWAEVWQLCARSVIATLRPCRWNRSVRFSFPPLAAPPFRTLHDFFQRLHVFWRSTTKALAITMRNKFREGALPRFLLPVSQRSEFSGIQSQFASHLNMGMAQPEALPRFEPRLQLGWYRHQGAPLRQLAAVKRSTAA
ncbi:hypothetical protein [Paraburkholderia sp. BL10I2N1]|uniref:hypothetical protein n=1 Tax=Paraburkholderia sp. BL10I2N1 TaxID=1938796 RepID=UPI0010616D7C|nr:hypothetical protein [Paraburkholderia sp. BL10I2N1]